MQRFSPVRLLTALITTICLSLLAACGGSSTNTTNTVAKIVIFPTSVSLNEGDVTAISATAQNSVGAIVVADLTFTSSAPSIATISTGGSICAGKWDGSYVVCTPTLGQSGVGQVTITVASGSVSATMTAYVHLKVDRVVVNPLGACTTMGQEVNASASVYSTSPPGCSQSAPCDITSTVGPIGFTSNDSTIIATSSGIEPTYSSTTNSPTYTSGGSISGSAGQTCVLGDFNGVSGASASVVLTGKNTIASGTHLTITAEGVGGTSPPTTAALGNGSATCSGTANVVTALIGSGGLTAENPGSTTVFSGVSGVNSVSVPYVTCPAAVIMVHDAASSNTSFSVGKGGTQALTADVYDINGQYIKPVLTWGSSSPATATVAVGTTGNNPATVTAVAPGTAYITASCSYPDCNKGLGAQYSQNVATVAVPGTTATTVYAASTDSLMLVPISTSTNTAGTVITLPAGPNSIVADPAGTFVYLGSPNGLMAVNVSTGAVTTYAVNGTVQAIAPDGAYLLISDPVQNVIYYFLLSPPTVEFIQYGNTTTSSAYTPDSKLNEWLMGNLLGVGFPYSFTATTTLPYTGNALDISGPGGLTYISSNTGQLIDVRGTCNQAQVQTPALAANHPTLLKAIPNGAGAVAADSPAIDVVTTGAIPAYCPPTPANSITSYDLGAGAFNAQQMFVSPDTSYAWIISDLPELLSFQLATATPRNIPLTGGVVAYTGGITLDSAQVYVGTSDLTVHRIDVASGADVQQIAVGLKSPNGNAVAPNLVSVVP